MGRPTLVTKVTREKAVVIGVVIDILRYHFQDLPVFEGEVQGLGVFEPRDDHQGAVRDVTNLGSEEETSVMRLYEFSGRVFSTGRKPARFRVMCHLFRGRSPRAAGATFQVDGRLVYWFGFRHSRTGGGIYRELFVSREFN